MRSAISSRTCRSTFRGDVHRPSRGCRPLVGRIEDRRIITYGENPQADARLVDLAPIGGGSTFKVAFRNRKSGATHEIADLHPANGRVATTH